MRNDFIDHRFTTNGGFTVLRHCCAVDPEGALDALIDALDRQPGLVMAGTYSYPGRYRRRTLGFIDPPLVLEGAGRTAALRALSDRGRVLLPALTTALESAPGLARITRESEDTTRLDLCPMDPWFPEDDRGRQPSLISVVRAVRSLFAAPDDDLLGLHGAFGYDIGLGFERLTHRLPRPQDHRDLVLYLPDRIVVVDPEAERAEERMYDILTPAGDSTTGVDGTVAATPRPATLPNGADDDMPAGAYAALVDAAQQRFAAGELFEVVPSRVFRRPCAEAPSRLYRRLRADNPAPYVFLANLGQGEHLIGASPEMYVRVAGGTVETCPISGTVARGADALEDAANIRLLLESAKEEAELTMCTDVDRNDKARVCVPGSVTVVGRRQIELYSRLIHTVDHVKGTLRPDRDALDAFLAHCWAVTVTGAPKRAAMAHIEAVERGPRAWYGGAIGQVGFDGGLDTGLVLRTIRLRNGIAEVRAGATLLHRSDPVAEEAETVLKASALLALLDPAPSPPAAGMPLRPLRARGLARRVLLIDHEDSFVHSLAAVFQAAGAETTVLRWDTPTARQDAEEADLLVLSPGPGLPADFRLSDTIARAVVRRMPVFGVCLGLQGLVEYFGGRLGRLPVPAHGVPAPLRLLRPDDPLFRGVGAAPIVGRYHSLYADPARMPAELAVLAETEDGIPMAVRHRSLPISAVQFHPESLMSLGRRDGPRMIVNLLENTMSKRRDLVA